MTISPWWVEFCSLLEKFMRRSFMYASRSMIYLLFFRFFGFRTYTVALMNGACIGIYVDSGFSPFPIGWRREVSDTERPRFSGWHGSLEGSGMLPGQFRHSPTAAESAFRIIRPQQKARTEINLLKANSDVRPCTCRTVLEQGFSILGWGSELIYNEIIMKLWKWCTFSGGGDH